MNVLFFELAMTTYLVVAVLFIVYLTGRREVLVKSCLWGTALGFLFHTAALGTQWHAVGTFPVTTPYETASFFSWALVLVFLAFDFKLRLHVLGAFVVPLAFLSVLAAAFLRQYSTPIDPSLLGIGLALHTSLIILGAVAFCIAFAAGIMYTIQAHLLKSKQFNPVFEHLLPLDTCDGLISKGILIGFPLTTLGLLSGAVGARYVWGSFWDWSPKETLSFLVWCFYLVMLVGRFWFGIRAKQGAYLAIFGFLAVMLSFVGLDSIFGESRHF